MWQSFSKLFRYSNEVRHALDKQLPIVALESTIISHGMPYPANVKTALEVEQVVRDGGAIPATIAILDGIPHIGLDQEQLEYLGKAKNVRKCSRRDLGIAVGLKENGATTVAGTMILAEQAGIPIFVTGGIGGVHREAFDGNTTLDVSADLGELGRTNVAVVCAGVKSILDVGRTLEWLETQGVSVLTLGQQEFPEFFTSKSAFPSPCKVDNTSSVAEIIHASFDLMRLRSGILLAVPNPKPMDKAMHDKAVESALSEMKSKGVSGKDATPFLLKRINEITSGDSLQSNIALIKHNAKIGAEIAVKLHELQHGSISRSSIQRRNVFVAGACAIDIQAKPREPVVMHTSNIGHISQTFGGVARNIAECICNFNRSFPRDPQASVSFYSAIGNDLNGNKIMEHSAAKGMDVSLVKQVDDCATAAYCALTDENGDLFAAIADMDISQQCDHIPEALNTFAVVVVDANLSSEYLASLCSAASKAQTVVVFEPVSVVKARKAAHFLQHITIMTPNEDEIASIAECLRGVKGENVSESQSFHDAEYVAKAMHVPGQSKFVIVTRGSQDIHVVKSCRDGSILHEYVPVEKISDRDIKSTSGAGDSFTGGFVWSLLCDSEPSVQVSAEKHLKVHIRRGIQASRACLTSFDTVPQYISKEDSQ